MNRAVTSHEVARLAGVSQATVSRVLRNDPRVRPATREKVLRVLASTKYEPNAAARSIRGGRTDSIGVVVARLSYQLYPAMLETIGAQLAQLGRRMIVWDAGQGDDQPAVRALRQGIVDGVILTAATAESQFLREVHSPEAPVVLINRTVDSSPADQVSSDNAFGGERVATYMVRCGRRGIALIGGIPRASTIRDRENGFLSGLASTGIALLPQYYRRSETFSHASGREAAIRLLELGTRPDSIFCVNDVLAAGAIDGARHLGLKVPDDVWIVGYDDIELASWDAYDLTTVRQPMNEMISCGIELLLGRIAEPGRPAERRCFPNDLVIRGSTARHPFPKSGSDRPGTATVARIGTRRTRNDDTKASQ